MQNAPFVWSNAEGSGDMLHVYFRREVELAAAPERAVINLFAYTNYHLVINGVVIGVGPARSYPEFPEYDTYDLAPHLRAGANVIGVDVLHVGHASFHALAAHAGFVAWGEVLTSGGEPIDLATGKGWRCRESTGHDRTTPKFSFAQPPVHAFDARLEEPGWDLPGAPPGEWKEPVELADASPWNELYPRSIPHLTNRAAVAERLLGAYAHKDDEQVVSFRVNQEYPRNARKVPRNIAFAWTYIHSPREQTVLCGTWWGEHRLNGKDIEQQRQKPHQFVRTDAEFALREGWNEFFVSYGTVQGIWEFHLAVPREAGLSFSPEKRAGEPPAFLVTDPFPVEQGEKILERCPPVTPDAVSELAAAWRRVECPAFPVSASKGLAWAEFGEKLERDEFGVRDIEIPAGRDASLVLDMGREVLGRPFVEFDAPAGTVVDVGGDETLRDGRPHHARHFLVSSGERHVARGGGRERLETFHSRGYRYLQVAVRNHDAPVTVRAAGMMEQVYPYEKKARFECSDPFMNTLWEYGYNTLRLCSEDVITDCPWRERTLYGGDLLPETATAVATTGDWRLPKRCQEVFLQSLSPQTGWLQSMAPMWRGRDPLHDYPLLVMVNVDWYLRTTGDAAFARRAEPVFRAMFDRLWKARDESGVVVNTAQAFVDWIKMTKGDRVCAVNALSARALAAWSRILTSLGHADEAAQAAQRATEVGRVTVERFWDDAKGAFADTIQDGKLEDSHFPASSAWAMLFAPTTPEQDERAIAHIERVLSGFVAAEDAKSTSPYGAFYVLGALYEKGAVRLAEDATRRMYADMIYHPTGTVWEHFNPDKSLCHAWSSAPTYYLSTRALGVRLGFPDATDPSEVLIAPESETLSWACGEVPHPLGQVRVEWRVSGDRLLLTYDAPDGAPVRIAPRGGLAELALVVNGRPA